MASISNLKILDYLRAQQLEITAMLQKMIELESPTDHKKSVDKLGAYLSQYLNDLGADVQTISQPRQGNHVVARWGNGPGSALILCHMDTVWDVGSVAERPVRIADGKLYGPGAYDMKGGIVIGLWAMLALREHGMLAANTTMVITSDEEIGSPTSRELIETEARRHDVVYVLEPAQAPFGALKTQRKGVGDYVVSTSGWSVHAGGDHEKGINAIEELAHQILAIQSFTDYQVGTTFSTGVVSGGTRSNVVPAEASVHVDLRIAKASEEARVEELMQSLKPHLPGATVTITGGLNRPPLERTPEIQALFARAQALGVTMGIELTEASSGGGSDGNFTAALGVPTLDGMGVVGDGAHSVDEYAELGSLPERAALLAAMLRQSR